MKRFLPPAVLLAMLCACSDPAPAPVPELTPAAAPAPVPLDPPPVTTPAAERSVQVPRMFLCRGNEPFWALDIHASGAMLKTPDSETELLGSLTANPGGSFAFRGAPDGSPEDQASALVTPGQCFDSMADGPAMPFSAQVGLPGGQVGSGCCSAEYGLDLANAPLANAGGKDASDWSRRLPELSEVVRRCVRDAGVDTEAVTTAWPINRGKAGVRLRDSGGDRFDCLVDLATGAIEDVRPVATADVSPGEGRPVWIPVRDPPPVLSCGRVERESTEEERGYLHYRDGCG